MADNRKIRYLCQIFKADVLADNRKISTLGKPFCGLPFLLWVLLMKKDTANIIQYLVNGAKLYDKHLKNRHILFLYNLNGAISYKEVFFCETGFLHLTGIVTSEKPRKFYYNCLNNKLSPNNIKLKSDGTTIQKLSVLEYIPNLICSPVLIGDFNGSGFSLKSDYLLGCTRKIAILGFFQKKNMHYGRPSTLLKGDIKQKVSSAHQVILIVKKAANENIYKEISYKAKNTDISKLKLPKELECKIKLDFH